MVTSTQAFFLQPQLSTNYRYNIHVPSNGSVIFVDAPLPGSVVAIRKDLRGDEMLQVSLDVVGTMLSVIAVSSEDWKVESSSIQAAGLERLGWSARNLANTTAPLFPGNLALMLTKRNHTYTCIHTQRVNCTGTWQITASSAILAHDTCLDKPNQDQDVVVKNYLAMRQFADLLVEFILKGQNVLNNIDVVTPALGAALRSRMVSLNGIADNPGALEDCTVKHDWGKDRKYSATPFNNNIQSPALLQH
ncbi:hypothetical protein B0J14DRAFT_649527 [Halenospora varia]|nr:hypothetical protein B0J14DRAFT_649527 [Halenospora varia]